MVTPTKNSTKLNSKFKQCTKNKPYLIIGDKNNVGKSHSSLAIELYLIGFGYICKIS